MKELESKIKEYREYKRLIEETKILADSIAEELKGVMENANESTMIVGEYKMHYIDVVRKDLDKKRLEAEHKALYDAYLKESTYKRFTVT
ncbi:MAG: hypothetical protein FWC92_06025 [Defluviitaleaceae bacterium]|nr:hypothetical protein [Defluviitaleaceae bacterium]